MDLWLLLGAVLILGLGLAARIVAEPDWRMPTTRLITVRLIADTSMRQAQAASRQLGHTLDRNQPWPNPRPKPRWRRSSGIE